MECHKSLKGQGSFSPEWVTAFEGVAKPVFEECSTTMTLAKGLISAKKRRK
jgi:hypothetical protein